MLEKINALLSGMGSVTFGSRNREDHHDGNIPETESQRLESMKPQTLDQMLRFRAQLTPERPLLSYPSAGTEYVPHTAATIDSYVDRAARWYSQQLPRRKTSNEPPKVVGLLGQADLDYVITMFALYRLGHTVVTLSPRLAKEGYTHLIDNLDIHDVIFYTSHSKMAKALGSDLAELRIHEILRKDVYANSNHDSEIKPLEHLELDMEVEGQNIAVIIHSSGSTGLPKPVKLSHSTLIMAASKNANMRAFSCVPFFHAFGLNSLHRGIYACQQFWFYNASLPLTSENLVHTIQNHNLEIFFCVPYALKLLAESKNGIEALKKCKLVWFAGSACPDDLGNTLNAEGIRLISDYGLSECGPLMTTMRPEDDHAWNYLRPLPHTKPYMRFEERAKDIFELVCLNGMPWKVATNRDDGSYATKDLFEKHPEIEDAYRFISRQDDTLVLSNGEKANPTTLEGKVRQHHLVVEAVMIGSGKSELGIVLVLSHATEDMLHDQVLDQVWPVIEKAQSDMPDHAKIVKSMVITIPAGTDFPRTDKGTVIRQQFYRKFAQEIEDAYTEEEEGDQLELGEDDLREFVRDEVRKALNVGSSERIDDDTDLFAMGVDSLQSTQLRRAFQKRLQLRGRKLPLNVVYENPTVQQICRLLSDLMSGQAKEHQDPNQAFSTLLETYGNFAQHDPPKNQRCVVLTGATGSLGAHLLAQLTQDFSITKIYCLVRASSLQSALVRVHESLQQRRLYQHLNELQKAKITALPSDLATVNLGLDSGTYRQICTEATAVIHAAWPVNFNLSLFSFQGDIMGTKNLIDLCLSPQRASPPTFSFCSSISTSMDVSTDSHITESVPIDLTSTLNIGYAQSKLVAENLCIRAAHQTGLKTYVMRIGQIVGDTEHGVWNASEAVPLMIQTASTIGALPAIDEMHRWMPVDIVAATVLESSLQAEAPAGSVMNIVNPCGFRWRLDLLPKLRAAGLEFKEVSVSTWLQMLRESDQDERTNPAIKLLSYFESVYGGGESEGRGEDHVWETSNTSKYSQTFSRGWQLSQDTVTRIISYFQETGWRVRDDRREERQASWSSDQTLDDEEYDSGKHRDETDADEKQDQRKDRADSQTTLHTDDSGSSDGKMFWNEEKKKLDVHDLDLGFDLRTQHKEGQASEASGPLETGIDLETVKEPTNVIWSDTKFKLGKPGCKSSSSGSASPAPATAASPICPLAPEEEVIVPREGEVVWNSHLGCFEVGSFEEKKLESLNCSPRKEAPTVEIEEVRRPKDVIWNGTSFACR